MPTLSEDVVATLLEPYLPDASPLLLRQLSTYLDLLVKWNARTNLTAIREPEEIVQRHFGESLFAARHLPVSSTLLDFGSGAGFPGLPIQLLRPDLRVTLAESQNKKASFLREAVRVLGLETEVWSGRVEGMPSVRQFGTITMRAVDNMPGAVAAALPRTAKYLAILTTKTDAELFLPGFMVAEKIAIPQRTDQYLLVALRSSIV